MTTNRRWTISPHAAFVDSNDRIVAADLSNLKPTGPRILVGPAAAIWRAVLKHSDEDAIISSVVDAFDVDVVEAADDIRQFLIELSADGLVLKQPASR